MKSYGFGGRYTEIALCYNTNCIIASDFKPYLRLRSINNFIC